MGDVSRTPPLFLFVAEELVLFYNPAQAYPLSRGWDLNPPPSGDVTHTIPLFLWVLWLNIGLVLSVCVVLEGLLLSIDSVFISV
jgi:hypothetical protein